MEQKIDLIHSSCKDCVFAKYDDKTQIDCHLSLLDKFKKADVEIIEAYDDTKEFYVINSKKCVGYKEEKYFKARDLEKLSLKEKIEYISDNLFIDYAIVVNIKNFTGIELKEICTKISHMQIKPKELFLIRYQKDKKAYDFKFLEKLLKETKISKWKIKTIIDDESDFVDILHHTMNENKKHRFILSIDKDYTDFAKIIEHAQEIIYEKFTTFQVLSNSNHDSLCFNTSVYRFGISNGIDVLSNKEKFTVI